MEKGGRADRTEPDSWVGPGVSSSPFIPRAPVLSCKLGRQTGHTTALSTSSVDKREPFLWLTHCQYDSLSLFRPEDNKAVSVAFHLGTSGQARGQLWVSGPGESRPGRAAEVGGSLLESPVHLLRLPVFLEHSEA